ncbi:putative MFS family arabinose efflux permease [Stackebrandtia albiflava]|uniref:Putative MFS family arabinose efflux permease n=1 Tax=Stackebrandtia albiflava TaxID=406432 RepID=A0A562UR64_9ACTN|nr:MFS transporter [Stackebrandtia albiflava]TWJ08113.1 putative MFS family arabinose efflux permease [Stackebrandtia albiflava]
MTAVRNWFRLTVGGLPRAFWHLWVVTLINRLGSFVLIYLTIYLSVVRDLEPGTIGLLLSAQGAGAIAGTQFAGVLTDRWSRRKTLMLSNFAASVVLLALAFAEQVWAMGVMLVLLGAALNMARPAFSAMITDIIRPADRVRAFTLNYWAINLGFAGAALLAGLVAGLDFHLIFFVNAAALAATGLLVLLKVPETRPVVVAADPAAAPVRVGRVLVRDRVFLSFIGLTFLPAFLMISLETLLPLQVTGSGLTEQQYSYIIATNGVIIVAGQLFIPRLVEGRRRSRVLALSCLFWAAGVGFVGVADTVAVFMLTVLIWTIGEMLQTPANSATIADLAPPTMRGRYQAAYSLAFQVSGLVAPVLGGLGMQYLGRWWWAVAAGVGVVAAIGNLVAEPARERRLAAVYAAEARAAKETQAAQDDSATAPEPVAPADRRRDDTGELAAVR